MTSNERGAIAAILLMDQGELWNVVRLATLAATLQQEGKGFEEIKAALLAALDQRSDDRNDNTD